jgi:hypothetical protein
LGEGVTPIAMAAIIRLLYEGRAEIEDMSKFPELLAAAETFQMSDLLGKGKEEVKTEPSADHTPYPMPEPKATGRRRKSLEKEDPEYDPEGDIQGRMKETGESVAAKRKRTKKQLAIPSPRMKPTVAEEETVGATTNLELLTLDMKTIEMTEPSILLFKPSRKVGTDSEEETETRADPTPDPMPEPKSRGRPRKQILVEKDPKVQGSVIESDKPEATKITRTKKAIGRPRKQIVVEKDPEAAVQGSEMKSDKLEATKITRTKKQQAIPFPKVETTVTKMETVTATTSIDMRTEDAVQGRDMESEETEATKKQQTILPPLVNQTVTKKETARMTMGMDIKTVEITEPVTLTVLPSAKGKVGTDSEQQAEINADIKHDQTPEQNAADNLDEKSPPKTTDSSSEHRFKCRQCSVSFSTIKYLKVHSASHNREVNKRHSCAICREKFQYVQQLNIHLASAHTNGTTVLNRPENDELLAKSKCETVELVVTKRSKVKTQQANPSLPVEPTVKKEDTVETARLNTKNCLTEEVTETPALSILPAPTAAIPCDVCQETFETTGLRNDHKALLHGNADSKVQKASADPTLDPAPKASADPTPKDSADPTPKASADPTPEASADPTLNASADPTLNASADPTPEASADATPDLTPEPKAPSRKRRVRSGKLEEKSSSNSITHNKEVSKQHACIVCHEKFQFVQQLNIHLVRTHTDGVRVLHTPRNDEALTKRKRGGPSKTAAAKTMGIKKQQATASAQELMNGLDMNKVGEPLTKRTKGRPSKAEAAKTVGSKKQQATASSQESMKSPDMNNFCGDKEVGEPLAKRTRERPSKIAAAKTMRTKEHHHLYHGRHQQKIAESTKDLDINNFLSIEMGEPPALPIRRLVSSSDDIETAELRDELHSDAEERSKTSADPMHDQTPEMKDIDRNEFEHKDPEDAGHNFKCGQCPASFPTAKSLKHHLVTHRVGKPHLCRVCNMKFQFVEQLNTHLISTHTDGVRVLDK